MAELDEKLAAMMADPNIMAQVAAMAKSLGMAPPGPGETPPEGPPKPPEGPDGPKPPPKAGKVACAPTLAGCFAAVGRYGWPERPGREPP